jgi:hypothetical protein
MASGLSDLALIARGIIARRDLSANGKALLQEFEPVVRDFSLYRMKRNREDYAAVANLRKSRNHGSAEARTPPHREAGSISALQLKAVESITGFDR